MLDLLLILPTIFTPKKIGYNFQMVKTEVVLNLCPEYNSSLSTTITFKIRSHIMSINFIKTIRRLWQYQSTDNSTNKDLDKKSHHPHTTDILEEQSQPTLSNTGDSHKHNFGEIILPISAVTLGANSLVDSVDIAQHIVSPEAL